MTDEKTKVVSHEEIGAGYRWLVVEAPAIAAAVKPGQFVHVRVPALEASALRRPFSVFDAADGRVTVLYKEVGRGTSALAKVRPGDALNVMGPLGKGFPESCAGTALLVGGGFGVAPLYFLARRLLAAGAASGPVKLFVGGRTAADLLAVDRFEALGGVEVHLATNDGSAGAKGLVTDPLDDELIRLRNEGGRFELFACGPDPMLRAVAMRATGTGAKGWISMDRHMICGVGACYACIQKTVRGNSRCCVEGPVFAAEDLVWG
ncbi:MAG: dihydroorotate dehydrogenase electron transfer subunit [Kiritimatiellae bacterium]|nr:dihydroorotate dehydrogenase electron transfer subunit [Kiritimatiellia bacterium]